MTKPQGSPVTEEQAREAWGRIKKGESSVADESRKLFYRYNAPLRRAISALPEVGRELYLGTIAGTIKDRKRKSAPVQASPSSGTEKA